MSIAEGWLFSSPPWLDLSFISLLESLLPAALVGSKAASSDGELLPMPEARRREGGGWRSTSWLQEDTTLFVLQGPRG